MIILVNGYGAPLEPLMDENLHRYLTEVVSILEGSEDGENALYLAGGYTNRSDLSEAAAMSAWLKARELPKGTVIFLIETSTTARGNLTRLKDLVGNVPVTICCEYSRRLTMKFFAKKLFSQSVIRGIKFDEDSLRLDHLISRYTIKHWLEVLAWHSRIVDRFRRWLRKRHIARARAATNRFR